MAKVVVIGLKLAAVLVLAVPICVAGTFALWPIWTWFETHLGIESIGHSFPASWCFVATYVTLSLPPIALILWKARSAGVGDAADRRPPE